MASRHDRESEQITQCLMLLDSMNFNAVKIANASAVKIVEWFGSLTAISTSPAATAAEPPSSVFEPSVYINLALEELPMIELNTDFSNAGLSLTFFFCSRISKDTYGVFCIHGATPSI